MIKFRFECYNFAANKILLIMNFKHIVTAALILLLSQSASALDLYLPLLPADQPDEPIENDDKHKGHRMPAHYVPCTISDETGVNISGVETSEINSYNIYDASGEPCFASYNNEEDFVDFLFSLEGEYVIQFVTPDKTYTGFISL